MVKKLFLGVVAVVFAVSSAVWVYATPSTTYWTTATADVQGFGVFHITYDSYTKDDSDFPTDYGLTVGVLPFEKFNIELGFDVMEPSDDPLFFNAKGGMPESAIFEGSPAWSLGVWGIGTEEDVTDYHILHGAVTKSLGQFGRIHLGGYYGLTDTLEITATDGDGDRSGFMIGYDIGFWPVTQGGDEFNRFILAGDYAFGENAIGGGGVGLYVFFTPDISLLTGPVWFNDEDLNGEWKWTLQLDINFEFLNIFKGE